jgi:enterochelin esterase family protein
MKTLWLFSIVTIALLLTPSARAADPLSSILVPGEDWKIAVEGITFADGPSCDKDGNLYFSNMRGDNPGIYRVAPDLTKTKITAIPGRSGTKFGPDGKLYACGTGKVVVYDLPDGKETVIVEANIQPNDLIVTNKGLIYITETAKKQVTLINPKTKEVKAADTGTINRPNGINISPDNKTLLVSDYGGLNVWTFTINDDGTLSNKKPAMIMKVGPPPAKPDVAGGDGMTVDTAGRAYVTTLLGVQIFAADGTHLGTLPKPDGVKTLVSAGFAGKDREYLYIMCGDKIYRRKTQAKGALNFQ